MKYHRLLKSPGLKISVGEALTALTLTDLMAYPVVAALRATKYTLVPSAHNFATSSFMSVVCATVSVDTVDVAIVYFLMNASPLLLVPRSTQKMFVPSV